MARPCKKRRICRKPSCRRFCPEPETDRPVITMTLEEYECLRLLDYEGLTQEECAAQLLVARTTVQSLYATARKRLAASLVEGRPLEIAGGSFTCCGGEPAQPCPFFSSSICTVPADPKGVFPMKLAITYDEATQGIFQHFGKSPAFKIYTVEGKNIVSSEVVPTNGAGHGALAGFLQQHHVDTLICGGIGAGAQTALAGVGITIYGGVQGNADDAARALLSGQLAYDPAVHCAHHEHHGQNGHTCGC